jgi:hypothetical protein
VSGASAAAVPASGDARDQHLLEVLARLLRDESQHLLTGPASEADIAALERVLGRRLPASYRTLLACLGWGIFYDRHELFGPHSLQLHDIEFVPSLNAVLRQLAPSPGPDLLPFHRGGGCVHLLDLRGGGVRALDGSAAYPDLAAFLEAVVLRAGG